MITPKIFTITDDSGFLAIVNADKYKSFVDEDWEYRQLLRHWIDQMNHKNLIIWETGFEGEQKIYVSDKQSSKKSFREFSKLLNVTEGQLYLTNFDDLTMAAQFEDESVPANHNKYLFVQVDNGDYRITIRQMFDPTQYKIANNADFEVILQKDDNAKEDPIDKVYWTTE